MRLKRVEATWCISPGMNLWPTSTTSEILSRDIKGPILLNLLRKRLRKRASLMKVRKSKD
jgi:hypothetical protein